MKENFPFLGAISSMLTLTLFSIICELSLDKRVSQKTVVLIHNVVRIVGIVSIVCGGLIMVRVLPGKSELATGLAVPAILMLIVANTIVKAMRS